MSDSFGRIIGILAVVMIAAAVLFVIEIQPRVGEPEAISFEIARGQIPEHEVKAMHAEQPTTPNVKMEIVMQGWGFIVNGQAATIASDGSLQGALPITVNVGDVVQITLTNKGKIVHDFNIALGEGEHQHQEGMKHQAESMTLNPGETQVFTFLAVNAGEYTYHCAIPGHTELGMLGSFIVVGEDAGDDHVEHDDGEHHEEMEGHHEQMDRHHEE